MSTRNARKAGWIIVFGLVSLALAGNPSAIGQESETLTHTFTFDRPVLGEYTHNGTTYTTVAVPGSLNMARRGGEPALPVKTAQMLLPPKRSVAGVEVTGELHTLDLEGRNLLEHPIFPYQNPIPFGEPVPEELTVDQALYASNAPFPKARHENPRTGFCRGYAIHSLLLRPVQYTPGKGRLSYYSKMTVTLRLEEAPANSLFRNRADDAAWVKRLVCNPAAASQYASSGGSWNEFPGGICDPKDDYDYVIITTTQNGLDYWPTSGTTPHNWDSLMNKHLADNGLKCTLVTGQDIVNHPDYVDPDPFYDDIPCRIRNFCKDAYQDWGISYVLIGGDDEWIPARHMDYIYEGKVDADIYWNHLDNNFNADKDYKWGEEGDAGFDIYGEFFIGRVTCDEPQDVSNWLNKNFKYMDEQDRLILDNAAFYGGDTGWNCQGDDFIDYSAIKGTDGWLGPNPGADPYPPSLGFQYGFETWNEEFAGGEFDLSVKWTAEPPNPGGWKGGSTSAATAGLRAAITNDEVTLLSGIAHANQSMSLDVGMNTWESSYHNTFPFFIHDYGCHCGDMDAADDGVLHSMLFHSDTELAFGCVYNTGYGWGNYDCTGSSSSVQQKTFWDYMFDMMNNSGSEKNWQLGKAQGFSKDVMGPLIDWDPVYGTWRGIIQSCLLFGDPALRVKPPDVPALCIGFPDGVPEGIHPPGLQTKITVKILACKENLVPGTETLHYRFDPGSSYTAVQLTSLGGDFYEAALPHTVPGDCPEFYFSAKGDGGTTVYSPWDAPTTVYGFEVCFLVEVYHDDFENETGWTIQSVNLTDGEWERADPGKTAAQPEDDHSPDGTKCFVTGKDGGPMAGDDVDGGPTVLTSPTLDMSSGDGQINFYLWFYHSTYGVQEPLRIQISNSDGAHWKDVEDVEHSPGWNLKAYKVSDYVAPTALMKVRFIAEDNPSDSTVEALVDDFSILRYEHDPSLWADAYSISMVQGAVVSYSLDAGTANGNRPYLLMGTLSGTSPGITLPGGHNLPLNWDIFTNVILANMGTPIFQNFMGVLDGMGCATATFDTLGPLPHAIVGHTAHFVYLLQWDFTSNPIAVTFDP